MTRFKESDVVFDEATHTYTRDGQQLSGITSLIHSVLRLGVYPGASDYAKEVAIPQAGYYGSCVHDAIRTYDEVVIEKTAYEASVAPNGTPLPAQDVSADLECYKRLIPDGMHPVASEFTVSYKVFASQIDKIWCNVQAEIYLVDFKTNNLEAYPGGAEALKEYLSWQLSCYAVMFELQTGLKVKGLYGMHLRHGEGQLWEIERKSDEQVLKLLDTMILPNPDYDPTDVDSLRFIYINDEMQVADTTEVVATAEDLDVQQTFLDAFVEIMQAEQKAKELKDSLRKLMEKHGVTKFECDQFTASIGKASVQERFDSKTFKEAEPELYQQYVKKSQVKGKFTVKLK